MKISGIMPTRGRAALAERAIAIFLSQTYADKELIIIDDEDLPSFKDSSLFAGLPIRYFRIAKKDIGPKRNFACFMATGDIIMHFDSDDWSAPGRMQDQFDFLMRSEKQVVGYRLMYFYDERTKKAFRYRHPFKDIVLGTSLTFFRSWWKNNPFPEDLKNPWGEDVKFVNQARDKKQILADQDLKDLMVARIHSDNTSPKDASGDCYLKVRLESLPKGFL